MNKVPTGLFILWGAGLVGCAVCLGLYLDSAKQGNGWLAGTIVSGLIFFGGIAWYWIKGNRS